MAGGIHGGGEHAWQGTCVAGGMHGRWGVHGKGHAWWGGGMNGRGVCMARGHMWQGACMAHTSPPWQILRDTVNERAVRILLECILVVQLFRCSRCSGNDGRIP